MVTSGSTAVTSAAAGAFMLRTAHDMVDVAGGGAGLAPDTAVVALTQSSATLSAPWTGASGPARLRFPLEPVELRGRLRADRARSHRSALQARVRLLWVFSVSQRSRPLLPAARSA
jgi:hypothetical protein